MYQIKTSTNNDMYKIFMISEIRNQILFNNFKKIYF